MRSTKLQVLPLALAALATVAAGCSRTEPRAPRKPAVGIQVDPPELTIAVGTSAIVTAQGVKADGSNVQIKDVVWSVPVPGVAMVAGRQSVAEITGLTEGTVTVRVSSHGLTGELPVTVKGAVPKLLEITPAESTVSVGGIGELAAIATFSDGSTAPVTAEAEWSVSDSTIAGIGNGPEDKGQVVGHRAGEVVVKAAWQELEASALVTVRGAELIRLDVTPPKAVIAFDTSIPLTAVAVFSDLSTSDVTDEASWTSSDEGAIQVSSGLPPRGVAKAVGRGGATVTATWQGRSGSSELTVTNAQLKAVEVSPSVVRLATGTSTTLQATAIFMDDTRQDVTWQASWISSDPRVASVTTSQPGAVKGGSPGVATVSAEFLGKSGAAQVTVTAAELVSLAVRPSSLTVPMGSTAQFQALGTYSDQSSQDVTEQVAWTSTDEAVATVSNAQGQKGKALARAAGTAAVTATLNGISAKSELTVTAAQIVDLKVDPASLSLAKGTTKRLTATATFTDLTTLDVTAQAAWSSSDNAVASVDTLADRGRVDGVSQGQATVTAAYLGKTATSRITVTPATLASLEVLPADPSLPKGDRVQMQALGKFTDGQQQDVTAQALWSTGEPKVAAVSNAAGSNGLVSGVGVGQTFVQASLQGQSGRTGVTVTAAVVIAFKVNPTRADLRWGSGTQQETATASYSDGSVADVTNSTDWVSLDPSIATVSSGGAARGLISAARRQGKTTVVASFSGKTADVEVTVQPPQLASLEVRPRELAIPAGGSGQLNAFATFEDGTVLDVTTAAVWSAATGIVEVGNGASGGTVKARSPGQTKVIATYGGLTADALVTVAEPTLTRLTLSPGSLTLWKGQTGTLELTATYSDGSFRTVTKEALWTSSDGAVCAVEAGVVKAVGPGKCLVTASFGGMTATATVTVSVATVTKLVLTPDQLTLKKGESGAFKATATYSDGSSVEVTRDASWSSSDPSVARVTLGQVEAVGEGKSLVTASFGGLSASAPVTVTTIQLTGLSLSPASLTLEKGSSGAFEAIASYSDGSTQVVTLQASWSSSDGNVCTATLGVVVATGYGRAVVTAVFGGLIAVGQVSVPTATLTNLTISPNGMVLQKGETGSFKVVATYSDGTVKDVTAECLWESSDLTVATVMAGQVKAVGGGKATITARFGGMSASAPVQVQAPELKRIAVVPPNAVLRPNLVYPYKSYALYSDGTTTEISKAASWTSGNPSVARPYTHEGYPGIWAVGAGTTEIASTYQGQTGRTSVQVFNSTLTGVEVSPAQLSLPVGVAAKLYGVFLYSDGWAVEILNPDWSSEDASVARVDPNGVVTAMAPGSTRIVMQAYDGNGGFHQATSTVVVTGARIVSISLDAPKAMAVGLSARITATGTFDDGRVVNLGLSPVWSSSDLSLATVMGENEGAVVKAKAAGTVTLSASFDGATAAAPVTLTAAALQSLELTVPQTALPLGGTSRVTVTGTYADGAKIDLTESVTYDAVDPDIAVIAYGIWTNSLKPYVIAEQPGRTTVRASLAGKSATKEISVSGATLQSLQLALGDGPPASNVVLSGPGPFQLRAVGTFTGGVTADVTVMCTFSPGQAVPGVVATISNAIAGRVTVLGKGSEQVTVTYAPYLIGQPIIKGTATLTVQ